MIEGRTVLSFAGPARTWSRRSRWGTVRSARWSSGAATRVQANDATAWSGRPDGPDRALAAVRSAGGRAGAAGGEARGAFARGRHEDAADLLATFQGPWAQAFCSRSSTST